MADPVVTAPGVFLDFSPGRKDEDADKENDVPVLTLIQFSKAPFVSFGSVKVGTSKSVLLQIQNPTEDSEAAVTVEKIPAGRGFSSDCSSFIIPPEGSFTLKLSWTPVEEGGVRELIIFNANGILKHQAVLLGRAEGPKKKKKSLWDAIKNKGHGEKVAPLKKIKADPPLKMAPNKTFQVGRNPQYKRNKVRSPLVTISKENAGRETSCIKGNSSRSLKTEDPNKRETDQMNQNQDPCRVLVVPAAKLLNASDTSTSSAETAVKPECKNLLKTLNRTLSPIGTPDRLKQMMPQIQTEAPPPFIKELNDDGNGVLHESPGLSLKDALAVIGSDLSQASSSPADGGSSSDFSDSLELKNGESGGMDAIIDSPEPAAQSNEPRLTFFVSKKPVSSEPSGLVVQTKKLSFISATVTKVRATVAVESPRGRKVKTSRRKLLDKTLDSQSDSGAGTPSLPVIDSDAGTPSIFSKESPVSSPVASPLSSLPSTPPPSSVPVFSPPPLALHTSSPLPVSSSSPLLSQLPADSQDVFPIQLLAKKRKSEEFLKGDGRPEREEGELEKVKRSRGLTMKVEAQEKRRSLSQRNKPAGTFRSGPSLSSITTQVKQPAKKIASKGSVKKSRVVAVAQSKLTFIRPSQTALPRHPTPFAATNMFYDERWVEKQERGFTWWLNYVLTPDDFKVCTHVSKANAVSLAMGSEDALSVPKAPTKEEMSFSTYTARRKLNSLRRSACRLFTSDAMVTAIRRLELEVEARRLLVRTDRHLWKDIGERRKVLDWLLSYNPLWLRIGLETIFGELISLQSNSDTLGLALFILQRLLWNPDIAAQFRHPRVPNLYRDGHEEALSRFTLKKLLLLVCFLDKAKESRLIQHDPCLFCLDAEFKSSKDLLLAFSRDFLSGEGNLHRHLGYMGLPVSHVQKPLDEFDFAVQKLSVDLKCGIRLVRVMELLLQNWGLSAKLRLPVVSRLQKVHNVDVALQELRSRGVDLQDEHGSVIQSKDIVDGHREKTLSLLWKIIFTFHVEVILDQGQLQEEICFLRESLRTKRRLASLRANQGPLPSSTKSRESYKHTSTSMVLLMDWVRAVCDFYNLKVENFSVSFSDGRVLCYLIHHYHPGLLPAASPRHATTQTVESSTGGRLELDCSGSDSDGSFQALLVPNDSRSPGFKELLENEKTNFRLVNSAVASLGGVPAMINPADMSNTIPSEKVVMSFLSFLCARLLDLRNETRAARLIQAAWRKYRLKKDLQFYQERNVAAKKIQAVVKKFLQRCKVRRQNKAAIIIQSFWRGHKSRRRLRMEREAQRLEEMHRAATLIQAQWRMFSALTSYRRLRYFAIVVQAKWRMVMAVSAYMKLHESVMVVQKRWRAHIISRTQREGFLRLRNATVVIQRHYRKWRALKTQKENSAARVIQTAFKKWHQEKMAQKITAVVKIQSLVRMWMCLSRYRQLCLAAIVIQARFRGHVQRCRFQAMKRQHAAAVTLQSVFRGHAVRKQAARRQCAAVVIQRRFRASMMRDVEREEFLRLRHAAMFIQAAYRGKVARESLKRQQDAATKIQAAFRRFAAQQRYISLRQAASAMQRRFRATALASQTKKEFLTLRTAAVTLQSAWKGRADRAKLRMWSRCATLIQAQYRRHRALTEYRSTRAAAISIQRHYRASVAGRVARSTFLQKKAACITLQSWFRGLKVRMELKKKKQAATLIQSLVRRYFCRKRYVLLQSAAIIVQSRFRALRLCRYQQNKFRRLKRNAIRIQAAFRGFRVRKELKERNNAATVLQAHFRMYKMRSAYLALKCAVIIIQERYRAKVQRDRQLQTFSSMKAAAAVIQAAYRCHRTRRMKAERNHAATIIQRKFLSYNQRKRFLVVKSAALFCQQRFRMTTMARNQRQDFLLQRRAAICLQAAFRGYQTRKQLRTENAAAATIQSAFKGFQQRSKYTQLRWATIVLQAHYRANREMRAAVEALRVKRHATIILQAAYRGMKTRQILKQQHQAAVVIQRAFRVHCQRRNYLTFKSTVIVVQRHYRTMLATRRQRREFIEMRHAAIILQSTFRGQQVRKQLTRCHVAATVIQAAFRKHREEVKFQALRLAAIILQRRYRAQRLKTVEVKRYQMVRGAALAIQATYRGMKSRKLMKHQHQAASVIQRAFRAQRERHNYLKLRSTVRNLQRRYRANIAAKETKQSYQNFRKAVIILQSAYRGQLVRKHLARRHLAATIIQAAFRKHREQVKFQALRLAAIILQRRYRAQKLQREAREKFLLMRRSAVVLQAAFRGHRARSDIAKMHRAASIIQANFRQHQQQTAFRKQRWAAVVLQQRFRAQKQRNLEVERYQELRASTVVLQAAYRGMKIRRLIKHQHQAASVIQRTFRAQQERHNFLKLRSVVLTLQRRYRANMAAKEQMQRYQNLRGAVVIFQSAYRGQQVRKQLACQHFAATIIQAAFRKHRLQVKFQALRLAAITIQRQYRAQRLSYLEMDRYQAIRKATIVLQAAYRGMRIRRLVKHKHRAASVLQSAFRCQQERRRFLKIRLSILTIQRKYRATAAAKVERENYLELRRAAIVLQSACRGQLVRKHLARCHLAATIIQAAFKKHREQIKFQALRLAAIILQRHYRAQKLQREAREKFLLMRRSAVVLQAAFRGHRVRSDIAKMHRAASIIQANFRRHEQQAAFRKQRWAAVVLQQRFRAQKQRNLEVERYQELRASTVVLQAAFRGMKSRRLIKRQHQAASVIQRAFRAQRERHDYLRLRSTILNLQRRYRANMAAKEQMQRYQKLCRAVVILQSAFRGQQVRKQLAHYHFAATVVQAAFRKHRMEVKYQALRLAAITIQRGYRAQRLKREQREKFLYLRHSATIVQAVFRGWRVRRDIRNRDKAAVVIQAWWRSCLQRHIYQRTKEAVVRLQRRFRALRLGQEERRNYARIRSAVTTLQKSYRRWTKRRQEREVARAALRLRFTSAVFHHLCAIKIQRSLRAHWALEAARTQINSVVTIQRWVRANQQRNRYLALRVKVITVQRAVRSWLVRRHHAATVIQHCVRRFLLLKRQKKAERGITKIQALWRGHRSRQLHDRPRVVSLRRRLREISTTVREEDKLCNKTSAALEYLLRYKHFSEILEGLKNLETATRLSPECCERLIHSRAIHIIFTLIRSCNRSVPCMDVITFSIQILLNLSKYHRTVAAVYAAENSVETLLELLQRYREKAGDKVAEKGGNIFTKACFLLALLLQDHTHTEEVKRLPKVVERIRSIYRLTARKHKMDAERSVTREKMNGSFNGRFLVPATPKKARSVPRFSPDWVLKKNKLKDVVDPLRAIQMVAEALDVVL